MKKNRHIFTIIFAVVLTSTRLLAQEAETMKQAAGRYTTLLRYLDTYYVDTVDFKKIVDRAIIESVLALDPHSSYITADNVASANEPLDAEFEGVGIEFAIINDTLTVQGVIHGGPSEKVGIMAGDKIVKIDSELVAGVSLTNEQVRKYLRGKKGTKVTLQILRTSSSEALEFLVVRDKIPIHSMEAAYQAAPGIHYVKLSRFAATSHLEMIKALSEISDIAPKGLILDLRGNSGGFLNVAIDIVNEFLGKGDLIVYVEGRAVSRIDEYANGFGAYMDIPLCVLVDENSASASEIVAGAIQDQDRGTIIGRRTFGKGLVQRMLPLGDGSELRLTIAEYYTPSGRAIQSPYEAGNSQQYYENFYSRYLGDEMYKEDTTKTSDSPIYYTLKEKRPIYGGGGVVPDVFIPRDTTAFSSFYSEILRKGVVIEFVNQKVDKKRKQWVRKYPDFATFNQEFVVDDELFGELLIFAESKGIESKQEDIDISRRDISNYVKALIGSKIVSSDSFYRIMNQYEDQIYIKAIEILNETITNQ